MGLLLKKLFNSYTVTFLSTPVCLPCRLFPDIVRFFPFQQQTRRIRAIFEGHGVFLLPDFLFVASVLEEYIRAVRMTAKRKIVTIASVLTFSLDATF